MTPKAQVPRNHVITDLLTDKSYHPNFVIGFESCQAAKKPKPGKLQLLAPPLGFRVWGLGFQGSVI